jgi:hypothetical protein
MTRAICAIFLFSTCNFLVIAYNIQQDTRAIATALHAYNATAQATIDSLRREVLTLEHIVKFKDRVQEVKDSLAAVKGKRGRR